MTTYVCSELDVNGVCQTWVVQVDTITLLNESFGITQAQATNLSIAIAVFLVTCAIFKKLSKIGE